MAEETRAAVVALGECSSYADDILTKLRALYALAEMADVRGARILVKPNLVDWLGDAPVATAAPVVGAVVDLLLEMGAAQVVVGDGPAFRRDAVAVAHACGLAAMLEERGVPFIDLNYDQPARAPAPQPWLANLDHLWLPRAVRDADMIVSVPKLKTHHWAGVSLSLKNLLGVLPGACYGWPKNIIHASGIAPSILGVYRSIPPVISVVDGIVGMEGDGPLHGTPVRHGLLAVGSDPVAVDVTCAELMGYRAAEIDHLVAAVFADLSRSASIEIRGVSKDRLRREYVRPPEPKYQA